MADLPSTDAVAADGSDGEALAEAPSGPRPDHIDPAAAEGDAALSSPLEPSTGPATPDVGSPVTPAGAAESAEEAAPPDSSCGSCDVHAAGYAASERSAGSSALPAGRPALGRASPSGSLCSEQSSAAASRTNGGAGGAGAGGQQLSAQRQIRAEMGEEAEGEQGPGTRCAVLCMCVLGSCRSAPVCTDGGEAGWRGVGRQPPEWVSVQVAITGGRGMAWPSVQPCTPANPANLSRVLAEPPLCSPAARDIHRVCFFWHQQAEVRTRGWLGWVRAVVGSTVVGSVRPEPSCVCTHTLAAKPDALPLPASAAQPGEQPCLCCQSPPHVQPPGRPLPLLLNVCRLEELDSARFYKLAKECGLLSRRFSKGHADVAFTAAKRRKELRRWGPRRQRRHACRSARQRRCCSSAPFRRSQAGALPGWRRTARAMPGEADRPGPGVLLPLLPPPRACTWFPNSSFLDTGRRLTATPLCACLASIFDSLSPQSPPPPPPPHFPFPAQADLRRVLHGPAPGRLLQALPAAAGGAGARGYLHSAASLSAPPAVPLPWALHCAGPPCQRRLSSAGSSRPLVYWSRSLQAEARPGLQTVCPPEPGMPSIGQCDQCAVLLHALRHGVTNAPCCCLLCALPPPHRWCPRCWAAAGRC